MFLKTNSKFWTRENILWASGLLEGEGCFTLATHKPKNRGRAYLYLRVDATSTDLDVLEKLQNIFGGSLYFLNRDKGKPIWRWCVQKLEDVYAICVAVYPFMCKRRQSRIRELVDAFKSPKCFLPHSVKQVGFNQYRNELGQYCGADN